MGGGQEDWGSEGLHNQVFGSEETGGMSRDSSD